MQLKIQKWGNSLALRIPKAIASDTNIGIGSFVNLSLKKGRIIIEPVAKPKYSLADMLQKINDKNIHREIKTGKPVGREIW